MKEIDNWQEINESAEATAPGAATDLLVIETDHETKVVEIAIYAEEGARFNIIIRDHDAANPETKKTYYLNAAGQLIILVPFDEPIFTFGADKEICVQNVDAGTAGMDYGVNLKLFERKE